MSPRSLLRVFAAWLSLAIAPSGRTVTPTRRLITLLGLESGVVMMEWGPPIPEARRRHEAERHERSGGTRPTGPFSPCPALFAPAPAPAPSPPLLESLLASLYCVKCCLLCLFAPASRVGPGWTDSWTGARRPPPVRCVQARHEHLFFHSIHSPAPAPVPPNCSGSLWPVSVRALVLVVLRNSGLVRWCLGTPGQVGVLPFCCWQMLVVVAGRYLRVDANTGAPHEPSQLPALKAARLSRPSSVGNARAGERHEGSCCVGGVGRMTGSGELRGWQWHPGRAGKAGEWGNELTGALARGQKRGASLRPLRPRSQQQRTGWPDKVTSKQGNMN
jgi:hypothetical protein